MSTKTRFEKEAKGNSEMAYSVAEAFLRCCERTVERFISKFLVNGGVKLEQGGCLCGSISFAPCEEFTFFAPQIWKAQFLSVVQFPFNKCHSPFSLTTFFEIGVY